MPELAPLSTFVKVAETGSFSRAAEALGLSKSAVSKHIAALEERLGARLINRTTRKLALTEVGAAFRERCARILAELEEAERAVGRMHAEPRGILRINAPMSFGVRHIAPALPEFMTRYPEIGVELVLNDRIVDVLDEGFDLAVRIARLEDSSLIARKLAPSRRVVCAAPAYWRRRGMPDRPEALRDHDCLIYTYLATGDEVRFVGPQGSLAVRVRGRLRANNGDVLRAAAVGGLGVYVGPTFIVGEDLRAGRLAPALAAFADDGQSVWAVYPHHRHLSAKVRAFVDYLAARFGPQPYWDV